MWAASAGQRPQVQGGNARKGRTDRTVNKATLRASVPHLKFRLAASPFVYPSQTEVAEINQRIEHANQTDADDQYRQHRGIEEGAARLDLVFNDVAFFDVH